MRVKWTEFISASYFESIQNMYPEADSTDFDKDYEGEVIGTTRSFWGTVYLTIMCDDGKVRDVEASRVTKINQ